GVTEARDSADEEFGEARLMEFLSQSSAMRPEEMVDALIQQVHDFSSRGKPSDDVTVVVMRRC
ncbi:MAG: SpoIIE family protein phosphatase, partial [Candidatus Eiseniibacteriota bacterium]